MSEEYDVLITGSKIVDGTGKPGFEGSVAIRGDKVVGVGDIDGSADREIDGSGLVTCPGFIDMHSHADLNVLRYPLAENLAMQGITTFVGGNCGLMLAPLGDWLHAELLLAFGVPEWQSLMPNRYVPRPLLPIGEYREAVERALGFDLDWHTLGEFLAKVEETGTSVNFAPLVGHNAIRLSVMGDDFNRTARPGELQGMERHVERAMEEGAFGLSTGLDYIPGEFASTEEVVALAKVVRRHGGLYVTHHRQVNFVYPVDERTAVSSLATYHGPPEEMMVGRYRGLVEAIEVSRTARIPAHISHISNVYTLYQPHPAQLDEAGAKATVGLIDRANDQGLDVTFDLFPNTTGPMNRSSLIGLFCKWLIQLGSKENLAENLEMEEFRHDLRAFVKSGEFMFNELHPRVDPYWMEKVAVVRCRNGQYEGRSIGDIARERNVDPVEMIFELLIEDPDTRYLETRDERQTEATLPIFLQHPAAMIGTDEPAYDRASRIDYPFRGFQLPHQNAYGLYAHYIGKYVRETPVLELEQAIKKASYLPAQRLGLDGRGVIMPGCYADVVVLDLERIGMKGDFFDPWQPPSGIEYVLVNGEVVYEGMQHTGARPGRVLRSH